ncbi:MAG: signal peptidase I [Defluviitaleaceae bacterium]|nr:signal peptidase I [Defluviitaleaceae bacterium]
MLSRISNPFLRGLAEWLATILLAVILFFVMRTFLFRTASVVGNSMEPTLQHGDMVVLNRLSYWFISPRAGDIVAFPYQGNPSEMYIKRVVGVPGDIIDLRNGIFYVNDQPMDDDFTGIEVLAIGNISFPTEAVPEGHFFVLGDNRNQSKDSRFTSVGTIPEGDMLGKVLVRIWPLGSLGRVGSNGQ